MGNGLIIDIKTPAYESGVSGWPIVNTLEEFKEKGFEVISLPAYVGLLMDDIGLSSLGNQERGVENGKLCQRRSLIYTKKRQFFC